MSNTLAPVAAQQSTEASTNPAAAGVVSNDTPTGETLAQGHKAMHASIEQLVLEREVWQENEKWFDEFEQRDKWKLW